MGAPADKKKSVKGNGSLHPAGAVVRVFAARLREWRRASGLPLKHVARDLGVSLSVVSEWEHGNRFPGIANLDAVSRYIGIPICCLLYHGQGHCPHGRSSLPLSDGRRPRKRAAASRKKTG